MSTKCTACKGKSGTSCEKCGRTGRTGGKAITIEGLKRLDKDMIYDIGSMEKAVEHFRTRHRIRPIKLWGPDQIKAIEHEMMNGNADLEKIMAKAEELIDEAIAIDPRLTKRSAWVRGEEGIDGCAALIASGDDRPYFDRKKMRLSDRASTDPCRVVISTDSKKVNPDNAAAFIAAAKISQQFRPLEIIWQGAWLLEPWHEEEGQGTEGCGHIFHVPLLSGDLDFRRLQFVLSSPYRDSVSYNIMFAHAFPAKLPWGGGAAQQSYLPGESEFVKESGIEATPERVARYAARWAGLESHWNLEVSPWEAEQCWAPPTASKPVEITQADRDRWALEEAEHAKKKAQLARERIAE